MRDGEVQRKWPDSSSSSSNGQMVQFMEQFCSIVRVDVSTRDSGVQSIVACSCFSDARKATFMDDVELVMQKMAVYADQPLQQPSLQEVEKIIENNLHNADMMNGNRTCMEKFRCIHTDCIRGLVQSGAKTINTVSEYLIGFDETDQPIIIPEKNHSTYFGRSIHVLPNIKSEYKGTKMSVESSCDGKVRFSSFVYESSRCKATCYRANHDRVCDCKKLATKLVEVDDLQTPDDIEWDDTRPPVSFKPRPVTLRSKESSPLRGTNTSTCGVFILACACFYQFALAAGFMDTDESARMLFDLLTNRYEHAPSNIFYDNACHGHSYCFPREKEYFQTCRFAIDRFHESNHSTCSHVYLTSKYMDAAFTEANSEVVEQINSKLQATKARVVRFMTLSNAVNVLTVYFNQINAESKYGKLTPEEIKHAVQYRM